MPVAIQWAAGILTFIAGLITLIWAAKRWGPTPSSDGSTNPNFPVSVMSGQIVNDPQLGQLLISGQALIMKELQQQTSEVRMIANSLDRIEEEIKWANSKGWQSLLRHQEDLVQEAKETNAVLQDIQHNLSKPRSR